MLVTIITVSKNSAYTIGDTIKSVQFQSYPYVEHIIIDGASTDDTLNVIKSSNHIGPFISEPDNGLYFAMNKGIEIAKGDIIGTLNADDVFYDMNVIDRIVKKFKECGCDATYSDLIFVNRKLPTSVKRKWIAGNYDVKKFLSGWMPPHPTVYVKKEFFQKYGMYDTRFRCSADYDLLLRFLYVHRLRVQYAKGVAVRMRAGGQSTKSIVNRLRAHLEDRSVWKLNNIKPHWFTLIFKPLRKIKQFIITNKEYA